MLFANPFMGSGVFICFYVGCVYLLILTWIGEFRPGNKTIWVVFDEESDFFRSQDVIFESKPSFCYEKRSNQISEKFP